MFALLEHEPLPAAAGTPSAARHWDFLIAVPGLEPLATWRLAHNPLVHAESLAAERIGDHRRIYLEYEGPLTGDRGCVRRLDGGPARVRRYTGVELLAELEGHRLRGLYEVVADASGRLFFHRLA